MIASELTLMGGCFAQDAAGAALDAYWAASYVEVPQITGTDLISVPFPGGSSASDEFWGAGNFDWSVYKTEWQPSLGVTSFLKDGVNYVGGCCVRDSDANNKGQMFHNGSTLAIPSGKINFSASKGQMEVFVDGIRYEVCAPAYSISMQESRSVRIRHWRILEFEYLQYCNAETHVKWHVMPMRGACGNVAIWENWTKTLTEL